MSDAVRRDPVIERFDARVYNLTGKAAFARGKLEEAKARIVRADGSLRFAASQEVAARQVELDALEQSLSDAKASRANAMADLDRREAERKQAAEIDAEVSKIDQQISKLRDQLEHAERNRAERVAEADEHRFLASKTKAELERDHETGRRAA